MWKIRPIALLTTTIRNFATAGATPGVYVMGKTEMPLYIDGHFSVYAWPAIKCRRLGNRRWQSRQLFNSPDTFTSRPAVIYHVRWHHDERLVGSATV